MEELVGERKLKMLVGGEAYQGKGRPGSQDRIVVSGSLLGTTHIQESLAKLLGCNSPGSQAAMAARAVLRSVITWVGWLLLCMSSDHVALARPHLGKFLWNADTRALRLLAWDGHMKLPASSRLALCTLIRLVASRGSKDKDIEEVAKKFGIRT